MTGTHIKLSTALVPITNRELWESCATEEQYFKILRERQRKGREYESLQIDETPEQQEVPGGL